MLHDLMALSGIARRLVVVCYANQHAAQMPAVAARLRHPDWTPTPEDCPVDWAALQQWYDGVQRTGKLVIDSY